MKAGNLVLIGLGVAAVLYYSNLGIAGATANFVFNGIQFNSVSDWVISITAQNVSNANINLNAMSGNVTVNGSSLGAVSFFPAQPLLIPAASQMNIPIHFSPSLLSIPAEIIQAIEGGTTNFNFDLKGNANVNGLVIPFDVTEDLNLSALTA